MAIELNRLTSNSSTFISVFIVIFGDIAPFLMHRLQKSIHYFHLAYSLKWYDKVNRIFLRNPCQYRLTINHSSFLTPACVYSACCAIFLFVTLTYLFSYQYDARWMLYVEHYIVNSMLNDRANEKKWGITTFGTFWDFNLNQTIRTFQFEWNQ